VSIEDNDEQCNKGPSTKGAAKGGAQANRKKVTAVRRKKENPTVPKSKKLSAKTAKSKIRAVNENTAPLLDSTQQAVRAKRPGRQAAAPSGVAPKLQSAHGKDKQTDLRSHSSDDEQEYESYGAVDDYLPLTQPFPNTCAPGTSPVDQNDSPAPPIVTKGSTRPKPKPAEMRPNAAAESNKTFTGALQQTNMSSPPTATATTTAKKAKAQGRLAALLGRNRDTKAGQQKKVGTAPCPAQEPSQEINKDPEGCTQKARTASVKDKNKSSLVCAENQASGMQLHTTTPACTAAVKKRGVLDSDPAPAQGKKTASKGKTSSRVPAHKVSYEEDDDDDEVVVVRPDGRKKRAAASTAAAKVRLGLHLEASSEEDDDLLLPMNMGLDRSLVVEEVRNQKQHLDLGEDFDQRPKTVATGAMQLGVKHKEKKVAPDPTFRIYLDDDSDDSEHEDAAGPGAAALLAMLAGGRQRRCGNIPINGNDDGDMMDSDDDDDDIANQQLQVAITQILSSKKRQAAKKKGDALRALHRRASVILASAQAEQEAREKMLEQMTEKRCSEASAALDSKMEEIRELSSEYEAKVRAAWDVYREIQGAAETAVQQAKHDVEECRRVSKRRLDEVKADVERELVEGHRKIKQATKRAKRVPDVASLLVPLLAAS